MKKLVAGLCALVLLGAGCFGGTPTVEPLPMPTGGEELPVQGGAAGGPIPDIIQNTGAIGSQSNGIRDLTVQNANLLYQIMQVGGEMTDSWKEQTVAASELAGEGQFREAEIILEAINAEMTLELERLQ